MTNYERRIRMSLKEMAKANVHRYWTAWGARFITSDNSPFKSESDALAYEIDWLNAEAKE